MGIPFFPWYARFQLPSCLIKDIASPKRSPGFAAFCGFIAVAAMLLPVTLCAQNAATLTDLGVNAPVPGANDLSQLSTTGQASGPDGLQSTTRDNIRRTVGARRVRHSRPVPMPPDIGLIPWPSRRAAGDAIDHHPANAYVLYFHRVRTTTTSYFSVTATNFCTSNDGDWLQWDAISISPFTQCNLCLRF